MKANVNYKCIYNVNFNVFRQLFKQYGGKYLQ